MLPMDVNISRRLVSHGVIQTFVMTLKGNQKSNLCYLVQPEDNVPVPLDRLGGGMQIFVNTQIGKIITLKADLSDLLDNAGDECTLLASKPACALYRDPDVLCRRLEGIYASTRPPLLGMFDRQIDFSLFLYNRRFQGEEGKEL